MSDPVTKPCDCWVFHPKIGSNHWNMVLNDFRQTIDHGDGNIAMIMAEQLFGSCPSREPAPELAPA